MHTLWEDLLNVLLRRKRLVLLITASLVFLAYIGLSFMGDRYEARSSLLVKLGRENTEVPVSVEKGGVFSNGVNKEEINSYISLIRSRHLIEKTIDTIGMERFTRQPERPKSFLKLIKYHAKEVAKWGKKQLDNGLITIGLKPKLEERELLILLLEKSLTVEREKETNVINLSLKLADPFLASDVLDALTKLYITEHIRIHQHNTMIITAFDEQTSDYQNALKKLSEKELELKRNLAIGNIEDQQRRLAAHISNLDDEVMKSQRDAKQFESELTSTQNRLAKTKEQILSSTKIQPSAELSKMRDRLAELRIKRAESAAKYQPNSPTLIMLDDEIRRITTWINQDGTPEEAEKIMQRNPIRGLLESRMVDLKLRLSSVKTVLETSTEQRRDLVTKLQALNLAENELQAIQLQQEVIKKRFLNNASRREEAKVQQLLNQFKIANVSVLNPPSFSWKPVSPKRLLIMLGSVIGGLALGMGLALFIEWTSDLLYDEKDFKYVEGTTFLGLMKIQQ